MTDVYYRSVQRPHLGPSASRTTVRTTTPGGPPKSLPVNISMRAAARRGSARTLSAAGRKSAVKHGTGIGRIGSGSFGLGCSAGLTLYGRYPCAASHEGVACTACFDASHEGNRAHSCSDYTLMESRSSRRLISYWASAEIKLFGFTTRFSLSARVALRTASATRT